MDIFAIMEVAKMVGGVFSSILSIVAVITLIVKPLRERFVGWIRKITNKEEVDKRIDELDKKIDEKIEELDQKLDKRIEDIDKKIDKLTELVEKTIDQNEKLQKEMEKQSLALQASLRDSILGIYYSCTVKGFLTMFEKENLDELYDQYTNLGGNHFIEGCYKELMTLPVKN